MKKIITWLLALYFKINKVAGVAVPVAVKFTQILKDAIDSGQVERISDKLQEMLPDWGDEIIIKLEDILVRVVPKIAKLLGISEKVLEVEDPLVRLSIISESFLEGVDDESRQKFLAQVAQQAAYDLSDGKFTWGEIGAYVQLLYKLKYK